MKVYINMLVQCIYYTNNWHNWVTEQQQQSTFSHCILIWAPVSSSLRGLLTTLSITTFNSYYSLFFYSVFSFRLHACICPFMYILSMAAFGSPGGSAGTESTCQCRRLRFNPWVRKNSLEREMAAHSSIFSRKVGQPHSWKFLSTLFLRSLISNACIFDTHLSFILGSETVGHSSKQFFFLYK